eukprot:5048058-Pleurochrysis_carterae.AAC.2
MLSVVIHVPEVEPNKGGRPGRARVTAPVFVVVLAVEVVGDVEKCVARLAKQHRQRPVSAAARVHAARQRRCVYTTQQVQRPKWTRGRAIEAFHSANDKAPLGRA